MSKFNNEISYAINYIEDNLDNPELFIKVGEVAGYSSYYFHRIFKKIINYPIMTYVRKRRLAKSLSLLTNTKLKIIDIALQSGFSYEQSFIRAFKEEFYITPSKYRKSKIKVNIIPKLSLLDIKLLQNGVIIPPDRVYFPELKMVGLKVRVNENEEDYLTKPNRIGLKFINEDSKLISGEVDRSIYYSKVVYISENRATCDYIPSYVCGNNIKYPDHLTFYSERPSEYILFKYIGNHSPYIIDMNILNDIYTYIEEKYNEYLFEHCSMKYKFERVDINICREDYCEMDFLFPVSNN